MSKCRFVARGEILCNMVSNWSMRNKTEGSRKRNPTVEERETERRRSIVFFLAEGHPAERWLQAQLDPCPGSTHTRTHLGCLPSGPDLRQLLTHTCLRPHSPPASCFTHADTHKHTAQPGSFLSNLKQPWSCPPLHHPLAPLLCVRWECVCVCMYVIWAW